ncbi:pyridoxamine 5'-phosphate oxidase family protein [Clostridium botulinum]|uniref:Pyridoxamine 5'-phosphate oxidase family protein n=1 Tax=Clostridium botulinum TaxID=1491 RepID=A0A6G4EIV6_CLOBO|nr:pyridoxamine 5'-phosphate oxidase family protein [Clostridium botulinum]APH18886.1 pyridoxamine 5'-phosphate oxidase family protein [Clostridium botulinum]AUM91013.1 MFS transporter [Clostridium botulinum]KEI78291.1 MFS transporter [Clostridium botulinum A2 117]MBN3415494.1 pyridoxamine 5'-phosphate oxidase family protein [Clostridium botulinum]MBN3441787.1 pyridoxamine 5'-phosphate oxidase family protein [Clostridium botulinum]
MFKEIRRKEKKLNNEESISLLKESNYGILSVCLNNGYAYGVPLNFVYNNGAIYFHCAREGQKLEAINENNKVSFSIVNNVELLPSKFDTNYESVITFGKAYEVFEDEKKQALLALINKYSKDYLKKGTAYIERAQDRIRVIKIEIEHITGKGQR